MDYYGRLDATTYAKLSAFALLVLWVIFNNGVYNFKKNIQIQKRISVLYWVLLFAGLTVFFQAKISLTHLQIITIPIGIFLGLTFSFWLHEKNERYDARKAQKSRRMRRKQH